MAHRAEQILSAIESNLTGLATTGANVFRGRVYTLDDSEVPAITIYQGSDDPLGEYGPSNVAFLDSELQIKVTAHVKTSAKAETELNQIRREVHIALMNDYQQGLPDIVLTTFPLGASAPLLLGDGETPTALMDMHWAVHYRSSIDDPGI